MWVLVAWAGLPAKACCAPCAHCSADPALSVEVHAMHRYSADFYGKHMRVVALAYIRRAGGWGFGGPGGPYAAVRLFDCFEGICLGNSQDISSCGSEQGAQSACRPH